MIPPAQIWEAEWLRIEEGLASLDADVSAGVIHELSRSFDATRQETKRLRILGATTIGFAAVALAADYPAARAKWWALWF